MSAWDQAKLALTLATAGPWLYVQGRQVRRRVPQLNECFHPQGQLDGSGPPIRLVFLGDSIMAGIGHSQAEDTLPYQLVALLAETTGRAVDWQNLAHNGASSADLVSRAPASLPAADLYLVSAGVNDALNLRTPASYAQNLQRLSQRGPGAPWLLVGLPNLREFPCFPYPLSSFLAWRVSCLEHAALGLNSPWNVHRMRDRLTLDTFSPDGFHPGVVGCRSWARRLLPEVMKLLKVPQKRMQLRVL
ncbi:SGNH/GDSL hydrolase family protein [bacterium]|nr:SGNH/GDSL hydrolase family protein [bacterium]